MLCQIGKSTAARVLLRFLGASLRYAPAMENSDIPAGVPETAGEAVPSRRKMLALGAAGVSAALTIRPAFAQPAVSVMNCERSEERRVGKGCVSPGRSGWSPYH